jgi:hypothetical protein
MQAKLQRDGGTGGGSGGTPAMASPTSAAPALQSGASYTPRPGNAQGSTCMGAVMARLHEMLGVFPSSQRLRPCGSSLQGGAPQAVPHRLDLLLTALPGLLPPAVLGRCALHSSARARLPTGPGVIDPTEAELAAMQQCLKPLGEAASEIGMDRPLSSYTQQEALRLINAVVTTYVEAMVQEHERSKYPPVRMQLDQSL